MKGVDSNRKYVSTAAAYDGFLALKKESIVSNSSSIISYDHTLKQLTEENNHS